MGDLPSPPSPSQELTKKDEDKYSHQVRCLGGERLSADGDWPALAADAIGVGIADGCDEDLTPAERHCRSDRVWRGKHIDGAGKELRWCAFDF